MFNSRKNSGVGKLFFEKSDFDEIKNCRSLALYERLSVLADMIRLNTLTAITNARSGHIGASFSAIEILTALYHHAMNTDPSRPKRKDRDIFIISKGHAAAALYAALASSGFIPTDKLAKFRRLGGLEGHAELSVPGVETNTGSLGIGMSKAKGFAWVHKHDGLKASVFVMIGDGELQEGQNWEAIQSAAFWKLDNLYLIIDRNYVQTDMEVSKILDVSPIEAKLKTFGWYTVTVDGHNIGEILNSIDRLKKIAGKPKAIIANTIKGKGVSFMEHPKAIVEGEGRYRWHDGIPDEEEYALAWNEIISRIRRKIEKCKTRIEFPVLVKHPVQESPFKGSSLLNAFSEFLVELGNKHKDLVVLDADLAESCGLRKFQEVFPERFIEMGIAEQNMVSTAGGLALAGKLPIVNTYAAFLTSRANEQIFNNASEGSKIIYVGHLAGILPAKPGKSHQGIRDISLLKAIPNIIICQPCNAVELHKLLDFLVFDASQSSYIRIEHQAPRMNIQLPRDYVVKVGRGAIIADGNDAVVFGYGPLLLSEILLARDELKKDNISIKVVDLPWLNHIDEKWLAEVIGNTNHVFCVENHSIISGLSEEIMRALMSSNFGNVKFCSIGIQEYGRSGEVEEILNYYGINSLSIAKKIKNELRKRM
jgi:transketolase